MQDKEGTTGFAILANERGNSVISATPVSWLPEGVRVRGRLGARQLIVLAIALAAALVINLAPSSSFRVNLGASMPRGLYRLTDSPARRGSLVSFCVEPSIAATAIAHGYLSAGRCTGGAEAVLKRVVAVEGDVVVTSEQSVEVNGAAILRSATQSRDSSGRPLGHYPFGRHRLGRGDLWVFSPASRSWDSRYFGPIHAHQVTAVVEPVFTFEWRARHG